MKMEDPRTFEFTSLGDADLIVDAIYKGGTHKNVKDDPIDPLVGGGNQGGFRYLGSPEKRTVRLCILYSDLADPEWPDELDLQRGIFVYYGDNKRPGGELHGTRRRGNLLLKQMFDDLHAGHRDCIAPILIFTRGGAGRDVMFRGLAVPGAPGVSQTEDLVAIWKSKEGHRFQNYRAIFTILNARVLPRKWINSLRSGTEPEAEAPESWKQWRRDGKYQALTAEPSVKHRTPAEQLPKDLEQLRTLQTIVDFYSNHPDGRYGFEKCAAKIFQLLDRNVASIDMTRFWRDGGRDALGKYRIGLASNAVEVDFALEAKCKEPSPKNTSGVRDIARLIARLRHRQFGVFVTTSAVHSQAYKEIIEDGHPVLILAGADIVTILVKNGISSKNALLDWLRNVG